VLLLWLTELRRRSAMMTVVILIVRRMMEFMRWRHLIRIVIFVLRRSIVVVSMMGVVGRMMRRRIRLSRRYHPCVVVIAIHPRRWRVSSRLRRWVVTILLLLAVNAAALIAVTSAALHTTTSMLLSPVISWIPPNLTMAWYKGYIRTQTPIQNQIRIQIISIK